MTRQPSRRDLLHWTGIAIATAAAETIVAACTSAKPSKTSSSRRTASTSPGSATSRSATGSPSAGSGASRTRSGLHALGHRLHGHLALPGQARYRPEQLLYNPRFADQPKPAAIALPVDAQDVAECVRFSAAGGSPLRIRNGGHSYGGWSSGPGLVVDLTRLDQIHVDRAAGTAHIGAGARLAEVYAALAAQGVSIGGGSCATVGVSGLTLGGGVGLLTRLYGLTCDQVESAQVVTADGEIRTVSAQQDPDLFWALRGGGGSFGAVTSWTFTVRPAPTMQHVYLEWDIADADAVVAAWQDWSPHTPRELWSTCKVLINPRSNQRTASVTSYWAGNGSPHRQINKLLRHTPRPTYNGLPGATPEPYRDAMLGAAGCAPGESAQSCIAAALTPAKRQPEAAASSILQRPLPAKAIHALVEAVRTADDVSGLAEGGVSFDALGGAVADVAPTASAFPWRSAIADIQYTATWDFGRATVDPGRYDRYVHAERTALLPYVGQSGYFNYADPQLRHYASAYWGANLPRLQQVKRAYDPHDVFAFPQAVPG